MLVNISLDHFGVVAAPLFAQLLNQSSDKRKRLSAFNKLSRMMKDFSVIPKNANVLGIALHTDLAGQITYQIQYEVKEDIYEAAKKLDEKIETERGN